MAACLGTTKDVKRIIEMAEKADLPMALTPGTVRIMDGDVHVYSALKKSEDVDAWIVRYNPDYFPGN